MPLYIKENEPNEVTSVLLPFGKDQMDTSVLRKYSGLNYDPESPLGPKDISCFFHPENRLKIFILGLGEEKDISKSYIYFRSFIYQYRAKNDLKIIVICNHLTDDQLINAVIGLRKGLLNNGTFKTNGNKFVEPSITIVLDKKRQNIAEYALQTVEAQLSAMFLVDHPSNIKTPEFMGKYVIDSGQKYGYEVRVIEKNELQIMGMDALLSVGQGSANPPVFIIMEYKPKDSKSKSPLIGFVGKGISFDAFKVDTSISDLKPVEKEVAPAKVAPPVDISLSDKPKEYRPGSYVPPVGTPFARPSSNFGMNQIERQNQNARGNNM